MWRASFIGVGIVLVIAGLECLVIDSATLAGGASEEVVKPNNFFFGAAPKPIEAKRTFRPSEWMPWSLLACGAIVVLYAKTLRAGAAAPG